MAQLQTRPTREELELAEETRLQAERQYRMVVDTATDAVITMDENGTITLVNPAVTTIFGYSATELNLSASR